MNIIDKNKYNEFLHVLSGCRTILDSYHFAEKYSKCNPETKTLVFSMINGKRYEHVLDLKTMRSLIEMIDNVKYKDEADEIIKRYSEKTNDTTQLKTLSRIAKSKILRPINETKDKNSITNIEITPELFNKKCPHCGEVCVAPIDTEYTICGYTNSKTGYNLVGCGKDWCFKCEKILCKKWDIHQLFLGTNKFHDCDCCKKHAKINNMRYPEDYCECNNTHVQRVRLHDDLLKIMC